MTNRQKLLIVFKLFFGLLGLSSILIELIVLVERGRFVPANFFSFFTVESNIFAALMLIVGALMVGRSKQPIILDLLRGAATLYMLMTGIIFSILLSGLDAELTVVPWNNTVLHYIMPIVLAIDWIADRPKNNIRFSKGIVWIIFPIAYVAYTLLRGAFVGWYPYPFLNPATGGYGRIFLISILITIGVLGLIWVMLYLNPRSRHKVTRRKNG